MLHPPTAGRPSSMAEYGVPDDDEGLLPWSWAAERLAGYRNYWVTTVSRRHTPHSMPVWGVWLDDQPGFYFSFAATSLKARNLSSNPNIVVGGDSTVEVVSLEGVAEPLADSDEREAAIEGYLGKYWGDVDEEEVRKMDEFLRGGAFYVVRPRRAFGMIETPEDFGPRATRWTWSD